MAGIPLSMLTRQLLALGASGFSSRYPHAWLVWEPGERVSPTPQRGIPATTVVPVSSPSRAPTLEDPLCFPLVVPASGLAMKVGRAPESHLVVDDLTVSREHFELGLEVADWVITVPAASNATTMVRSMSLQPGEKMKLLDGCTIVAGGVQLTYLKSTRLLARLVARAEQLTSGG
ncbi:MAG: FHA domain-containing protein [Myxococcales bacterium]|nr:FHA domain-containing protein [Myxococcales bacterium]